MPQLRQVNQNPLLHGDLRRAIEPILREHGFTLNQLIAATSAYTPTNVTTDRSFDADTVAIAELADVVGTLIADLQAKGLIS